MSTATPLSDWTTIGPGQSLWDGSPIARTLRLVDGLVGRLFARRFRLGPIVERGSLCNTYDAYDVETRQPVAVELFTWPKGAAPPASAALHRESRRIVGAVHPGLRAVHSIGVENGVPFVIAAPVAGEALSDRLARTGRMTVAESLSIALQVLDALAVAHAAGLAHGNLKPSKIRLTATPSGAPVATVMGLGMTTLLGTAPGVDTRGIGTPPYLAPEQLTGFDAPDELSDVWGVGLLVFEMVTGKRAFDGACADDVGRRIASEPPPSLRALRPSVPRALEMIISGALTRSREQRLSLRDLVRAFSDLLENRQAHELSTPPSAPRQVIFDCSDPCDDAEAPTDLYLFIETDLGAL